MCNYKGRAISELCSRSGRSQLKRAQLLYMHEKKGWAFFFGAHTEVYVLGLAQLSLREKLRGNNKRAKSFRHFFALLSHVSTFLQRKSFFQNFSPGLLLKVRPFLKREWAFFFAHTEVYVLGLAQLSLREKLRGNNKRAKYFWHFFALFHTFPHFFRESFCESEEGVRLPRERG